MTSWLGSGARTGDGGPSLLWAWGPVWALMAAIFAASSVALPAVATGPIDDKVLHALVYGLLGGLMLRALSPARPRPVSGRAALLAVALATLYGLTDEVHQSFVPGRSADAADLLADFNGAAVVCGLLWARRASRAPGRAARRGKGTSWKPIGS